MPGRVVDPFLKPHIPAGSNLSCTPGAHAHPCFVDQGLCLIDGLCVLSCDSADCAVYVCECPMVEEEQEHFLLPCTFMPD
jgi:hypothetical protein